MAAPHLDGVFVDFYGTLADGDRVAVEGVCGELIELLGLPTTPGELAFAWAERFFAAIERCNHQAFRTLAECECDTLVETLAVYGKSVDPRPFVQKLTEYWSYPPLHTDARGFLSALAAHRLPVCLVSNADRADIDSAIARHGLGPLVAEVVTSEDARSYKPLPAIFELALRQTGWSRQRVLHIGDSLHSDVGGALAAGLPAVWLNRPGRISDVGQHRPHHSAEGLTELIPILLDGASDGMRRLLGRPTSSDKTSD
jgi:2-haloacid dehalogenase